MKRLSNHEMYVHIMASPNERMIVHANEIPIKWRLGASAASWTILAGFFIFPRTFTSLRKSEFFQGN